MDDLNPTELLLRVQQLEGEDTVRVRAQAFITVAPFFKLYSTYCGNYQRALSTVAACRASGSGLSEVLASCTKNKAARGLSLESFLIKPVQRLTKYPLFFNDLLKQVPADAAARADLEKAAALVRDVSQAVDRSMAPEQFKLLGLLGQLEPLGGAHRDWLSLLAPHRQLLAEIDNITFATSTQTSDAVAYVLTDSLLVCTRGSGGRLKPRLLARLDSLTYGAEATEKQLSSQREALAPQLELCSYEGRQSGARRRPCVWSRAPIRISSAIY